MDVARFLTLIQEGKLYFARRHELGDPWEGVWTKPASDQILSRNSPEFDRQWAKEFNSCALISCWHENDRESVAMWKLYVSGREGVALKTTAGRLGRVLTNSPVWRSPRIRRVQYEDKTYMPQLDDYPDILYLEWFLFRKGKGYEHEREVRAVIYDPHDSADVAFSDAVYAANNPSGGAKTVMGEALPVDLSILIERIVVSPDFPKWAISSLQKVVDARGLGVQVESSSLLDQPSSELVGS
jgi:hypothetical protein